MLHFKGKKQYLLTCKVSSEQILSFGVHDSRPMIWSNVGSMMYMSGDSPFIA